VYVYICKTLGQLNKVKLTEHSECFKSQKCISLLKTLWLKP